jgi:hypothetical protein
MAGEKSTAEPKPTQASGGFATGQGQQLGMGGAEFGPAGLAPRVAANPAQLSPRDVLLLQRTVGNQAVLHMLGRDGGAGQAAVVQRRLTVGPVDDRYEREADEIARQVQLSRIDRKPNYGPRVSRIQRRAAVGPEGGALGSDLEGRIRRSQNGGSSLPNGVRSSLESKLNADFGGVKVHTGSQAVQLNRELGAKAFTHKNHIFYGAGQSPSDLSLTAHEAVHTIQQGAVKRKPDMPQREKFDTPNVQAMPDIQRTGWQGTKIKWSTASSVIPSSAGALGGVAFATVGNETHVVKPGEGTAANTIFAEEILSEIGGAQTTESVPVAANSREGVEILAMLRNWKESSERGENMPQHAQRWAQNFPFFERAQFFMVQQSMLNRKLGSKQRPADENAEFSDVYRNNPLLVLRDEKFLYNIGRALVADLLIGNADRLESINGGNFFVLGTSQVGAIDNEAFMPSMKAFKEDLERRGQGVQDIENLWVDYLLGGGAALNKQAPTSAPAAANMGGFDIDRWTRTSFASYFYKRDTSHNPQLTQEDEDRINLLVDAGYEDTTYAAIPNPQQQKQVFENSANWQKVTSAVKAGYNDGLKALRKQLTGSGMEKWTKRMGELEATFGSDRQGLDPAAFQVRGRYMLAIAEGKASNEAIESTKMATREGLVEDKIGRVIAFGRNKNVLDDSDVGKLRVALSEMNKTQQNALVKVRPGTGKQLSKVSKVTTKGREKQTNADEAYELLRAKLLKKFITDYDQERGGNQAPSVDIVRTQAYRTAVDEAADIKSAFQKGFGPTGYSAAVWLRYEIEPPNV